MTNKKIFLPLLSFLCFFSLGTFTLMAQEKTEVNKDIQHNFTIVQNAHNLNLNPHTSTYTSEAQILGNIYEGLFSYEPSTLAPVPAIAESYKISRNKRRWTFTLRENAKFSNGNKITAQTVKDSWISLLANKEALYASLFDIISGAEAFRTGKGKSEDVGIIAKDERTLIVQLDAPASHFNRILCHHAFSVIDSDHSAASGPFYIAAEDSEFESAESEYGASDDDGGFSGADEISDEIYGNSIEKPLVLKKNPFYWDAENVHLPQITILFSDDAQDNTYLFNAGNADWVCNSVEIEKVLVKNSVHVTAEFGTQYLFFKSSHFPWNKPEFRMALLTAVPWEELRKNYLIKAENFIYPLYGYPAVTGFKETDTDAEEALELIKEAEKNAGFAEKAEDSKAKQNDGASDLHGLPGNFQDKPLELVFGVIDNSYSEQIAEILRKAWEPLGVTLKTESKPSYEYLGAIPSWDADLFTYTWIGDFSDPLAFLELFRSNSTLNVSKYSNPEFDSLLDEASADETENHLKLLAKAEQILLDDGMIIPISHPVSLNAIDLQSIGGWFQNSLDVHPFKYIYFKENQLKLENLVRF